MSRRHARPSVANADKASEASSGLRARTKPAAKSYGAPLDKAVRAQMETRFGTEFSAVRIHADAAAADSARSIGATAYTAGHDIVFGEGRYAPHGDVGQKLLAHELAHVVQQSRGGSAAPDAEAKADRAADQVAQDQPVATSALGGAPLGLQAKPDDNATDTAFAFPIKTLSGFALNSESLTPTHATDLDSLAWGISLHLGMRKNGRATISVVGHTDRSGDEKLNQALGQRRADAARQGLIDALKKQGIAEDKFGRIDTSSMGESSPAVPTADGVKNEKNRRVEIQVSIGSQAATPQPAKPRFDPFAPLPPGTLDDHPDTGPRRDPKADDLWRRMEENQKKIDEFDRKHPRTNKSLSEAMIDKVMEEVMDPLIRKLPVSKDMKELVRSGVRKGLEKGVEAACEAAIDAGATGKEAEALKAACKAVLQTKPGGDRP